MKAGKNATKCQTDNGGTNTDRHTSKEKYHTMFQNEIKAENIEDNLRLVISESFFPVLWELLRMALLKAQICGGKKKFDELRVLYPKS